MLIVTGKGRSWERVRFESYTRRDGKQTELAVWRGVCEACGDSFEVKTPKGVEREQQSSAFTLVNCPAHRLSQSQIKNRWLAAVRAAESRGAVQRRVLEAVRDLALIGSVKVGDVISAVAPQLAKTCGQDRRRERVVGAIRRLTARKVVRAENGELAIRGQHNTCD